MYKFIAIIALIPILVSGVAIAIAYVYNPSTSVYHAYISGWNNPPIYDVSSVRPDGRPVFLYISDDLSNILKPYRGTKSYTYAVKLKYQWVPISNYNSIEEFKAIVFTSLTTLPPYSGSIDWSTASKIISFIENNKITEFSPHSSTEFSISGIGTRHVYIAFIVVFKPDTTLGNTSPAFHTSPPQGNIKLSDAIMIDLKGNYTVGGRLRKIISGLRKIIIDDLINVNMEIVVKIMPSPEMIARLLIATCIVIGVMYYDYRKRPDSYRFLQRILGGGSSKT